MKDRSDIKNFILKIEKDFPVNEWKFNDVHIWPFIRIKLFFYLITQLENPIHEDVNHQIESNTLKVLPRRNDSLYFKIKKKLYQIKKKYKKQITFYLWLNSIPKRKEIYLSSHNYRRDFKEKKYNIYFDTIIDIQKKKSFLFFECDETDYKKKYNYKKIYNYQEYLKIFNSFCKPLKSPEFCLNGYDSFIDFLSKNNLTYNFAIKFSIKKLKHYFSKSFLKMSLFFEKILKKINPEKLYVLCYYTYENMCLVYVANKMGIKTIELQHGVQSDIHLAYANWSVVPKIGYEMLPKEYWFWDDYSKSIVNNWACNVKGYLLKVTGNPWIEFWKNHEMECDKRKFILYSLQPEPLKLNQLFHPNIINAIRLSSYSWFIRLHPRQRDSKSQIIKIIEENNLLAKINIDDATDMPLPLLLQNTFLHITHCSSVAIEANEFNVKTVLLNKIGCLNFPHLLQNNKAIYIDYEDNFFNQKLNSLIKEISYLS